MARVAHGFLLYQVKRHVLSGPGIERWLRSSPLAISRCDGRASNWPVPEPAWGGNLLLALCPFPGIPPRGSRIV